jgi:Flp pilus assembly protein CpaB
MTAAASIGRAARRLPAVDVRVVTGIVLVAVSVLGGLRLTQAPPAMTRVYVAAADLDAGHVLSHRDLAVAEMRGSAALTRGLERVGRGEPTGRVLRTPLRSGAAVSVDALGAAVPPGREITVPVTPEHALGGAIRIGDRIDVFASFDKGTDAARTVTVARGATVRGVTRADGLFGQRAGSMTAITVAVEPDAAVAVAFAARNGELDIVRSRGELDGRGRGRFDADSLR